MDKKSIIGIAVAAVLFLGFSYLLSQDQKEYQENMARWQAQQDSLAAVQRAAEAETLPGVTPADPAADSVAAAAAHAGRVATLGESLAVAREGGERFIEVENDVMRVRFSTLGGRVVGVTLKEYAKYGPRGERTEPVELMDPATADFALDFYLRRGNRTVPVSTADYCFTVEPVREEDGVQRLVMRLPVAEGAALEYEYLIYNTAEPGRDYLVDFRVRMAGMAPLMAAQRTLGLEWAHASYQNEKGFQNENMYTTAAWHLPGESSVEELSMSEEKQSDEPGERVDWIAFKQQFFSSVFIAPAGITADEVGFTTYKPGSGYMKHFSARMKLPYDAGTTAGYDFAFYFGPNRYSTLKHVAAASDGEGAEPADLNLERLIPLGWGIFGWVNRWCVIPVFDLLRGHIGSFGVIILILAVLIRLIISPMTYKSYVSMAKMRLIKPEVDELNRKYPKKEDAMKRQQATMELYKKAGINPMGGCIPMLIQLPILIAVFRFLPSSIELRGEAFLWAEDLSSFDSILDLPFSIPFYGDHVSLFALLMALSTFVFSYINYQQTASSQPQMAGMKFMMVYMMPAMLLLWFNSYSSGLCWYYLLSNLLTIGQTFVIRRMVDDTKIRAVMEANAARKSNGKKSRFQQRYEELMRQQEAARNARRK